MSTPNPAQDLLPYVQEPQTYVLRTIEALSGQIEPLNVRQVSELTGLTLSQTRGALASATSVGWVQASYLNSERVFLLSPQVSVLALNQYAAMQKALSAQIGHLQNLSDALQNVTKLLR